MAVTPRNAVLHNRLERAEEKVEEKMVVKVLPDQGLALVRLQSLRLIGNASSTKPRSMEARRAGLAMLANISMIR